MMDKQIEITSEHRGMIRPQKPTLTVCTLTLLASCAQLLPTLSPHPYEVT
jgi:hypothetical protein